MRTGYHFSRGLTVFLLTSAAFAGNRAFAASCESLADLRLPGTTITVAQQEAAGTFTPPKSAVGTKSVPVAFCRVGGTIKPTGDSDIKFELWLPQTAWTGRYESVGNGGFAGSIPFGAMVRPLTAGSAVAGTDDGHITSVNTSAEWALGHPEKIIDFAYRAVHVTATVSKLITGTYYGSKPKYSYFIGCSTGGREALTEAQRYPNDFDGIAAGDPGNQWAEQHSGDAANMKAFLASEAGYISPTELQKIGDLIVDECDGADGVKDGLIADPRQCRIDLASLPLTPAQLKTYQALHDGPKTSSGKRIFPGMPFGSESVGWAQYFAGPNFAEAHAKARRGIMANETFANLVYHDPKWDFMSFDPDKSPADLKKAMYGIMDATDPQFAGFKAHGGKLISYHGWADSDISPFATVDYYNRVVAAQERDGGKTTTIGNENPSAIAWNKTQAFYRLFMVPGMGHCGGGPGPNQFGQTGGDGDADHDVVVALERWVEKGLAPERIVATKYVENDRAKGIAMTRPLCVFPKAAKYVGTGDTNDASNFICADTAMVKK
jgi:feruloyl esterase